MAPHDNTLLVEDAEVRWRNFEGRRDTYNDEGKRNFVLFLPKDKADEAADMGMPVKVMEPREEGEEPKYFVRVKVKMEGKKPANVIMISYKDGEQRRTPLNAETVELMDGAWLKKVDVVIRAYKYDFNGRQGVSVWLNSFYGTLEQNPHELRLEEKYGDIPMALDAEELEVDEPEATF